MTYSQSETSDQQKDHQSLAQDMQQSILWHCGVICLFGLYMLLADLASMLVNPTQANISQQTVIGVEFIPSETTVDKKIMPLNPEEKKPVAKLSQPIIPPVKQEPKVINQPEPNARKLRRTLPAVKTTTSTGKNNRVQVQRQASQQSSVVKTSTSKRINIQRQVGAQTATQSVGNIRAHTSKQINTQGVLKKANAQVLAAKKTISSAPKVVKTSTAKKTAESLTKAATAPKQSASTQVPAAAKKATESASARTQLNLEKQRQIAIIRAKQLAEAKQKAEVAAEKKRQYDQLVAQTVQRYGQMITEKIQQVALFNPSMNGLKSRLKIQLKPDGNVQSVSLSESSGNSSFDRLAINAVYKAAPLPLPDDQEISEQMMQINLIIRPDVQAASID